MKNKILCPQPLIIFLDTFFQLRNVVQHLRFFEEWLLLVMTDRFYTQKTYPADILFFYDQFVELYKLFFNLIQDENAFDNLNRSILSYDLRRNLSYTPQYLSEEEVLNPTILIQAVFSECNFNQYELALRRWLEEALYPGFSECAGEFVFPLYKSTKKLIEVSWLLHHAIVGQDELNQKKDTLLCFSQTCPLLLTEQSIDPYYEIESFFNVASLGKYRKDLKDWFMAAFVQNKSFECSSTLVFFHNQLIRIIHAGYLIVKNKMVHQTDRPFRSDANIFRDKIHDIEEKSKMEGRAVMSDYEIYALSNMEKLEPLQYLGRVLKLQKIKQIRCGLQKWLYCALSKKDSLMGIDEVYLLQLHETLEKLLEAFFLLIASNKIETKIDINNHD